MFSPSQRIWGYETPDGSFAQFCRVQDRQLMERPQHLTWEESACYTLTLATAYRMLFGHRPHVLRPGHNVLVWGASGGLGSMAVQLCATSGANAIGVVSDDDKRDFVHAARRARASSTARTSTAGASCRRSARPNTTPWFKEARKFGAAIWEITGKGNNVDFVFEHPGAADLPGLGARREARRHGRHLRRHHRLQPHHGRALSLDAPEACSGLALRQPAAGFARPTSSSSSGASIPACRRSSPGTQIPKAHMRMLEATSTSRATWPCSSRRRRRDCARSRTCSRRVRKCTSRGRPLGQRLQFDGARQPRAPFHFAGMAPPLATRSMPLGPSRFNSEMPRLSSAPRIMMTALIWKKISATMSCDRPA